MSGEEEFSLNVKLMCSDHATRKTPCAIGGRVWRPSRHVDEEEFADAWRPPT